MILPMLILHKTSRETHISDTAREGTETVLLTEKRHETFLLQAEVGRHSLMWYFRITNSASSGRGLEIMYRNGTRTCHKASKYIPDET